jgi:NADPH:quinone reductase-like Zn-dependent oxidoreductase
MARQWILNDQKGFETSLKYEEHAQIPDAETLGPNEVIVRLYAASLNYRDLALAESSVSYQNPIFAMQANQW